MVLWLLRYDTIRDAVSTCFNSLIYRTKPITKNGKKEKRKKVKTDMLRNIGKQSGESVEPVLKKKRRLRWEGFAEKEGFRPVMKE